MKQKPKIIFLLASISQPRCLKRIRSFIERGFEVEIYGFDRGTYNINSSIENHDIVNLGFAPSGTGYLNKVFFARKKINEIFQKNKSSNIIYYSFSFDISLICRLYRKKYIYEISDLVYGYFHNKTIRNIFAMIDRKLISKSYLTVMTSKGFNDYLFPNTELKNIIVQPNRVDSYFSSIKRAVNKINTKKLAFSYVGAFRYPNTVFRFAKVIGEKYPEHTFMFFGDSILTNQVKELASKYDNVKYFGQFKNPEDLPQIYSKIDIVIACYDIKTLNERIAEPNKLYESMFFNKPIIVSKDTFLEKQVLKRYKCGFALDASKDENIVNLIDSLKNETLNQLIERISKIEIKEIVDDKSIKITDFIYENI
ncbi:MAG: glycosyltransferase [Balneolaceae bacterium]